MTVPTILEDTREIAYLEWNDGVEGVIVGSNGVTKIVAYAEPGEYCNRPWFAVYKGDELYKRLCANGLFVGYKGAKP